MPEAVGTNVGAPCDVMNCGPPFVLLPEQALVLQEYGLIILILPFVFAVEKSYKNSVVYRLPKSFALETN